MIRSITIFRFKGGFGNQLFQYAALNYVLREWGKTPLFIDAHSGFLFDRLYKRNFKLGALPTFSRLKFLNKSICIFIYVFQKCLSLCKINTTLLNVVTRLEDFPASNVSRGKLVVIDGYFQDLELAKFVLRDLQRELRLVMPYRANEHDWFPSFNSNNAIFIGIRMFDEAPDPHKNFRNGKVPTAEHLALRITEVCRSFGLGKSRVFIASAGRNLVINELESKLPNATLVLADSGFADEIKLFDLMASCKFHVIMASTLFLWGSLLSDLSRKETRVVVFDSFNSNLRLPREWTSLDVN